MNRTPVLLSLGVGLLFTACSSPSYKFQPVPGKTAALQGGYAYPPADAPPVVHAAIAAGNRIAGLPYRRGGGHARLDDTAYDCSGATSYVLRESGLMRDSMPAKGFRRYGSSGEGKWISIYARRDHVFLVVAGLRFDTGWNRGTDGPRWTTEPRPAKGAEIRHPEGL